MKLVGGRGLPQGSLMTFTTGVCVPFLFNLTTPALSSQLGSEPSGVVIGASMIAGSSVGHQGPTSATEQVPSLTGMVGADTAPASSFFLSSLGLPRTKGKKCLRLQVDIQGNQPQPVVRG